MLQSEKFKFGGKNKTAQCDINQSGWLNICCFQTSDVNVWKLQKQQTEIRRGTKTGKTGQNQPNEESLSPTQNSQETRG